MKKILFFILLSSSSFTASAVKETIAKIQEIYGQYLFLQEKKVGPPKISDPIHTKTSEESLRRCHSIRPEMTALTEMIPELKKIAEVCEKESIIDFHISNWPLITEYLTDQERRFGLEDGPWLTRRLCLQIQQSIKVLKILSPFGFHDPKEFFSFLTDPEKNIIFKGETFKNEREILLKLSASLKDGVWAWGFCRKNPSILESLVENLGILDALSKKKTSVQSGDQENHGLCDLMFPISLIEGLIPDEKNSKTFTTALRYFYDLDEAFQANLPFEPEYFSQQETIQEMKRIFLGWSQLERNYKLNKKDEVYEKTMTWLDETIKLHANNLLTLMDEVKWALRSHHTPDRRSPKILQEVMGFLIPIKKICPEKDLYQGKPHFLSVDLLPPPKIPKTEVLCTLSTPKTVLNPNPDSTKEENPVINKNTSLYDLDPAKK